MAETRKAHTVITVDRDQNRGFRIFCKCGWSSPTFDNAPKAVNAWGNHLWYMDQQNLPNVLAN